MAKRSILSAVVLFACAREHASLHPGESKWPYSVESPRVIVHYEATGDVATARDVLAAVENAWTEQITRNGGRAPFDNGTAGPDRRFDVWLQHGIDELYVTSTGPNPATPYDDAFTTMVLDPWGRYGGGELAANVFHEFRHASQGADDWNEHIAFFEAEATLWEVAYYGYPRLSYVWKDFQAHPDWNPFKDGYKTWFMYGGALFLMYLRDHVFHGTLGWSNEVWLGCRNPPGVNEPDFVDSLDAVLAHNGTTFFAELTSFARARWYYPEHGLPAVASRRHAREAGATRSSFVASSELLGTTYTIIQQAPTDGATLKVSLAAIASTARPVVQLVGQGDGDRVLDLSAGSATVAYRDGQAVLAVTMLPASGQFDPDTATPTAVQATVELSAP